MPEHISHAVFHLLPLPTCGCARIYARQRIIFATLAVKSFAKHMLFLGAGVFLFLVGAREDGINDGIHSPVSNLSSSLSVSALVPMKLFKNVRL